LYSLLEKLSVVRIVTACLRTSSPFVLQGPPVGLHGLEVRDTSAVVLWEPPAFDGRTPVNGYYLDVKEASAGEQGWKAAHEKVNKMKYMKVRMLNRLFDWIFLKCLLFTFLTTCVHPHVIYGREIKRTALFFNIPFDSSRADSGDGAEVGYILRLPCACSESCWSWKALSSVGSNPGPDSPW